MKYRYLHFTSESKQKDIEFTVRHFYRHLKDYGIININEHIKNMTQLAMISDKDKIVLCCL